jgi:hypothetical protein
MKGLQIRKEHRLAERDRLCPRESQAFPEKSEESPLPQQMGVWKTAIIR